MNKVKEFIINEVTGWKVWEIIWIIVATVIITGLSIYWGDNVRGIITATTGVICVILTGKGKMSCYIFGLVNTALYAWISFEAKYFGEVMLNALYYVPMQFVGWFMWKKHMSTETKEVEKTSLRWNWRLIWGIVAIIAIYGYALILKRMDGNLPFIDSMSTCLSVLAMIFSIRRLMEQWVLWVIIDVVTVYMWFVDYLNGGTDIATLLMWAVYLINAIIMLTKWIKESKKENKNEV